MSSGGSDTPQWTNPGIDQGELAKFMQTQAGQQFAGSYDPTRGYAQNGNSYVSYDPTDYRPDGGFMGTFHKTNTTDVTPFVRAFKAWQAGNAQTQNSWNAYADTVAANEGGQGDTTVTTGAGVGQRQQLLGSLANAGRPGAPVPTAPTPGLGTFGMNTNVKGKI